MRRADRLFQIIQILRRKNKPTTADAIAQNILWNMRKHAGMTARTDDVTMIVAKVL